jgi:adenylate cyclase
VSEQAPATPGIDADELARRSGCPPAWVHRLVELGVLSARPGPAPNAGRGSVPVREGPEAPFSTTDTHLVRLLLACDRAGIRPEAVAEAVAAGRLSFAWLEGQPWALGDAQPRTWAELCAELGLDPGRMQRLYQAAGFPRPALDAPPRERDGDIVAGLAAGQGLGLEEAVAARITRAYGENLRRLTQAEAQFYHAYVEGPLLASGLDERAMRELAAQLSSQLVPVVDRMVLAIYHRHQERYMIDDLVQHIEAACDPDGQARRSAADPAMCFLDLVGYTRLTEELGDAAAARLVVDLADVAQQVAAEYAGEPVKWLGDGVMFHFPDPGPAVVAALDLVAAVPEVGLPPAHVGLHTGPVVFQDGDAFGRTVNLAARIAARAGADQVLVSDQVVAAAAAVEGLRFEPVGLAALKGVTDPVALHQALPAGRDGGGRS